MILKKIYLSWRPSKGDRRFLIGVFSRENANGDNVAFEYIKENVEKAKKKGFYGYPEFPEFDKKYKTNIKTALSLRLIPKTRADRENYLSFWKATNPQYDWFDELGFTQGKLATDTFEFLADFPKKFNGKGISFISDIAGLTHLDLNTGLLKTQDKLRFETEQNNKYDKNAVKLFKDDIFIGYVKVGHNLFFHKVEDKEISIEITTIEKNGRFKQIYYCVSYL